MKTLNICIRDYAGLNFRLSEAINKFTEHESRQIVMVPHKWGYPYDICTKDGKEIGRWIDWADVVNCWGQTYPLRTARKIPDHLIITHVGSYFRLNPEERHREALEFGAKELVCTPDLMAYFESVNWLPNAVPLDEWSGLRQKHKGKPIVCQSPSSLKRKNTPKIRRQLHHKENIDLRIIRLVSWQECMKLKALADIYLGAFNQNYGMSDLEAWAMGIPVISHIRHPYEKLHLQEIGYLPYYDVPLEKLSEAIDALLEDKELYREYSERGYNYVRDFHDYPVVAKRFISYCEKLWD